MVAIARSISSSVVPRPRPKRTDAWASSSSSPRARRTWHGSGGDEVQAEPEETARSRSGHQERVAVDPFEGDVQVSREPRDPGGRSGRRRRARREALVEPFPQSARGARPRPPAPRTASSSATPRPTIAGTFSVPGRSPRSWPPPWRSGSRRTRGLASAHEEEPDALRPVELVAGDREEIDAVALDVEGELADGLGGVAVEEDAPSSAQSAPISRIGWTCRSRCSPPSRRRASVSGRSAARRRPGGRSPVGVDRRTSTEALGAPARAPGRARRGARSPTVTRWPPLRRERARRAEDRQVVRLGGPGGEDDLRRLRRRSPRRPSRAPARPPPRRASRRRASGSRVAELLGEVGQHRLEHARVERRRRVVVEVDREFRGQACPSAVQAPRPAPTWWWSSRVGRASPRSGTGRAISTRLTLSKACCTATFSRDIVPRSEQSE